MKKGGEGKGPISRGRGSGTEGKCTSQGGVVKKCKVRSQDGPICGRAVQEGKNSKKLRTRKIDMRFIRRVASWGESVEGERKGRYGSDPK